MTSSTNHAFVYGNKLHKKMTKSLDDALSAKRESKYIEFKSVFDVTSTGEWCEVIKDVVAIANTGGGAIVIGVDNKGKPTGADVSTVLELDPAKLTDKLNKYTGVQFSDFEIQRGTKRGKTVAVVLIGASPLPMVFTRPGTYTIEDSKQKTAFSQGTVYFRHGAKSEPGTSADLRDVVERRLNEIRHDWLSGVRRVVEATPGSAIQVISPEVVKLLDAKSVRIVDDPTQATGVIDTDQTHPFRQKELIAAVRKKLPKKTRFNSFDVLALKRVYKIENRQEFSHQRKFGSLQYSEQYADWIVKKCQEDEDFFTKTRKTYSKRR
ncbi:putative DNA binding domain-containing protein [Acidobacteria bacterium AH-259-G07]|nr:putative DNA binding domain-containing protein [Acidobacteria bacterium AH-259-G07]